MAIDRGSAARFWRRVLSGVALFALPLVATPSCMSDGGNGVVCSLDGSVACPNGKVCLLGPTNEPACFCSTETEAGCGTGTVCEEVPGGFPTCFPPVSLGGHVFDLGTSTPIAGALVVARDENFAAVSGVAVTDAMGAYTLTVPTKRSQDGKIAATEVFLRADALGYITFPTAPRIALPIDMTKAMGVPPHLESSATNVGMLPVENPAGLGTVSGKVLAKTPIGTLVVAGGAVMTGGGLTGIAGVDGSYTVFNVPAGAVQVNGYKQGLALAPASAAVTAGAETKGVDLADNGEAKATVSGNVNIVNPGMGTLTSVILAVDETFNPNAARGEAPPGLRAEKISSNFSFKAVPPGHYVVLAAFENDFLVRDPDTSIAGTQIAHITVGAGDFSIGTAFKITGSLDDPTPDQEQVLSGTPQFVWDDDAGEDHYEVRLFDAYGNKVWEDLNVPGVSGPKTVTVDYAGMPLKSGMLYQFRAVAIKNGGTATSMTEDLRGVFLYK